MVRMRSDAAPCVPAAPALETVPFSVTGSVGEAAGVACTSCQTPTSSAALLDGESSKSDQGN